MRRRGHNSQDTTKNETLTRQDMEVQFTTKYIDTLKDLQRLEDENKRLMRKMKSLEVWFKPIITYPLSQAEKLFLVLLLLLNCMVGSNSTCIQE